MRSGSGGSIRGTTTRPAIAMQPRAGLRRRWLRGGKRPASQRRRRRARLCWPAVGGSLVRPDGSRGERGRALLLGRTAHRSLNRTRLHACRLGMPNLRLPLLWPAPTELVTKPQFHCRSRRAHAGVAPVAGPSSSSTRRLLSSTSSKRSCSMGRSRAAAAVLSRFVVASSRVNRSRRSPRLGSREGRVTPAPWL